ncbi:DgyrCDS6417 [Dimorphilus gyrociliatus]|uniref:Synaptogyrin n=1 Tax=Dimorphilus gyrociliatus TaxID=2664684 RepID=A0A7I8VQB2_9ANNE|nr:DgyrCDS6417 [Dimorphilus gyrociliatus]
MESKASGAYGAGMAGGAFNVLAFVKKPQVILRIVSWFFAIIVFGCISSQGWEEEVCKYNNDKNACGFGTAIGVIAFLGLTAFLIFDALFENFISSVQHRKYIVMADMGFSGVWTFFWFVCFCYLTDAWRKTTKEVVYGVSGVQAAIAFSFFSIASFAGITFFAFQRYRQGISETFASQYDQSQQGGPAGDSAASPYSGYPAPVGDTGPDPYQQPTFNQDQKPVTGDFQAPAY